MRKPLIGLTMDFSPASDSRPVARKQDICFQPSAYLRYVERDECIAVHLGTPESTAGAADLIDRLDGLLLTGGDDVDPAAYGQTPLSEEWRRDEARTRFEVALIAEAIRQKKPVLGICRGHQMINVACGGTLIQDIPTQRPEALQHRSPDRPRWNFHDVTIETGSLLHRILGSTTAAVNTSHHQAVDQPAQSIQPVAHSSDGIVEALQVSDEPFVLGVQWHPEAMADRESSQLLISAFIRAAAGEF